MPLYGYRCTNHLCCTATFTLRLPARDAADGAVCPACGEVAERIITAPARVNVKGGTPRFHERAPRR